MNDDIRYGIFLRPDPRTCWAVTQITLALRQQYGFVAAAAFAPHATLIGNLKSNLEETALVDLLDPLFSATAPMPVYNHGLVRTAKGTFEWNVNLDAAGERPNAPLNELAATVKKTVLPIHVEHDDRHAPNVADYHFAGHIGLASFELTEDNRLSDEVGDFIVGLGITPPTAFVAEWYTLFRFQADWRGKWWEAMPWQLVKSWRATQEL